MAQDSVWTVFAGTVSRFGEKIAVEIQRSDGLDSFTYRQIHDLASSWADWLAAQGVAAGDRCAILAHNDAHWCAVYLGILKLGAVAVPLDTNYSAKQVATIVRDSGAKLLFVSDKLRETTADVAIPLANLHATLAPAPNPWHLRHRNRWNPDPWHRQ